MFNNNNPNNMQPDNVSHDAKQQAATKQKNNYEEYLTTVERCQRTGKIEISLRYCTQCLIDMPLRARHCREC